MHSTSYYCRAHEIFRIYARSSRLAIILVNAEHYGASVREVADGTKNADSAGLNRFPIRPATFARSAAHAQ